MKVLTGFLKFLAALTRIALLIVSIAPYMPAFSVQFLDLPSHFVVQYTIAAVVLTLFSLLTKAHPRWFFILFLIFVMNGWQLYPYLMGPPPDGGPIGKPLKVLQANTLDLNTNTAALEQLISVEKPDIVVNEETTAAFAKMLEDLKSQYPYQHIQPSEGQPDGIAVISKLPLEDEKITTVDDLKFPLQSFTVTQDGQKIRFVSLHPATPLQSVASRDRTFANIEKEYKGASANLVILGDFNATPWAPAVKKLSVNLEMTNARAGRGLLPTWPANFPAQFLRLPIDLLLYGRGIEVTEVRLGSDTGSDHLPLITVLAAKAPAK